MTPQQLKAMKLALDAQQIIAGLCADKVIDSKEENILRAAIKQALAAPAQPEQEPCVHAKNPKGCYRVRCQVGDKCVDDEMSFRTTPPQPEQEPVAWVCYGSSDSKMHDIDFEQIDVDALPVGTMLYTRPPQRKPLLASEIVTMYAECPTSDNDMIEFARAIEAAHGIKENT